MRIHARQKRDGPIPAKLRAALGDPDTRAKMREATNARWADPLMREKMITGMRAAGERRRNRDTAES